jgi:uncharacterized membrane protein YbaN (DUF454 family)
VARPGRRWLRLTLGCIFIVLGVAGLVLPILQGVLFLAIGLGLLSRDVPWARRILERLRARHPEWAATLDRAAVRVRRLGERLNRRGSA